MSGYRNARNVTPSDSTGLGFTSAAISLGAAGAVTVDMADGESNILLTLPAGLFPIRVTKVYSTGTSATGIAAYW